MWGLGGHHVNTRRTPGRKYRLARDANQGFACGLPNLFSPRLPIVVAPATRLEDLRFLTTPGTSNNHCDMVEWRLDGLLNDGATPESLDDLRTRAGLPVLLTPRARDEGGERDWGTTERADAVDNILRPGMWIDVEAAGLETDGMAKHAARWIASDHPLVFSTHDFHGVPEAARLMDLEGMAAAAGAAVFKVAATPSNLRALAGLADWFEGAHPLPVAAMAMGRFGLSGRLLFAQAGSALNYGYLRAPTVPGQWPAATLKHFLATGAME